VIAEPAGCAILDPFSLVLVEPFAECSQGCAHVVVAYIAPLKPEADEVASNMVHELNGRAVGARLAFPG
jgi:hypothetical protein